MADRWYVTSIDLPLLYEVFQETCAENEAASNSPFAKQVAQALVAAFETGIQDKAGLLGVSTVASIPHRPMARLARG
jgi:hypothetical protein